MTIIHLGVIRLRAFTRVKIWGEGVSQGGMFDPIHLRAKEACFGTGGLSYTWWLAGLCCLCPQGYMLLPYCNSSGHWSNCWGCHRLIAAFLRLLTLVLSLSFPLHFCDEGQQSCMHLHQDHQGLLLSLLLHRIRLRSAKAQIKYTTVSPLTPQPGAMPQEYLCSLSKWLTLSDRLVHHFHE